MIQKWYQLFSTRIFCLLGCTNIKPELGPNHGVVFGLREFVFVVAIIKRFLDFVSIVFNGNTPAFQAGIFGSNPNGDMGL